MTSAEAVQPSELGNAAPHGVVLDINAGAIRGTWPTDVTSVIPIAKNVVARYSARQRKLEIIQLLVDPASARERRKSSVATRSMLRPPPPSDRTRASMDRRRLSSSTGVPSASLDTLWLTQLPCFTSMHHFSLEPDWTVATPVSGYILGVADDRKRYAVLHIRFNGPDVKVELRFTGRFVVEDPRAMFVPFYHKSKPYLLQYARCSGHCVVTQLGQTEDEMSVIVSKAVLSAGWTDVVWRVSANANLQRQRFFCYDARTGKSRIESLPFDDAVDNGQSAPSAPEDRQLQIGCIILHVTLEGAISCVLYSHSAVDVEFIVNTYRSSGKCLPLKKADGNRSNTSLLLAKSIFSHDAAWTHFCVLHDFDDADDTARLLSYSQPSGLVWISSLVHLRPETVVPNTEPGHGDCAEGSTPRPQTTPHVPRRSPSRKSGNTKAPKVPPGSRPSTGKESSDKDAKTPRPPQPPKTNRTQSRTVDIPRLSAFTDGPEPSDSRSGTAPQQSLSPSRRFKLLEVPVFTGNYAEDLKAIIAHLHAKNPQLSVDAVRLAMEMVDKRQSKGTLQPLLSTPRESTAHQPWRPVNGRVVEAESGTGRPPPPGSWLAKFEREYVHHLEQEVKTKKWEDKTMTRLYDQALQLRQQNEAKSRKLVTEQLDKGKIGRDVDPARIPKLVEKLAVQDVQHRRSQLDDAVKKQEQLIKQKPVVIASPRGVPDVIARVYDQAIKEHSNELDELRRKHLQHLHPPSSNPVAPLSPQQEKAMAKRLIDDYNQHRLAHLAKIESEMVKE